jgi:hypothetical protein
MAPAISATWASVVPRSKAGTEGDSRAITSPRDTLWPTCGSWPLATSTRPARLACTRPDADGSGITVPTISIVRAAFAVSVMDVRTPSSHCAGFGMKTEPSDIRRAMSMPISASPSEP